MLVNFFGLITEPLAPEKLFNIGPIPITNSLLFGLITAAFVIGLLYSAASYSQLHPKSRLAYYVELLIDGIWSVAVGSFGDRRTALKHLPFLATLFIFILFSNLSGSGLVPFVGPINAHLTDGSMVSLLRPFTTDLNGTLAMAILTIGLVQFYALKELGLKNHLRHYFTTVTPSLRNPMNYFIARFFCS